MSFSYQQPQSHQQAPASPLPESLRQEIRKTFDNELMQLRKQLQQQTLNAWSTKSMARKAINYLPGVTLPVNSQQNKKLNGLYHVN